MTVCAGCGEENPDRARFCLGCGAQLAAQRPGREVRKTVSVLFCDLVGSTELGERLDPEALRGVLDRYFAVLRTEIEAHGGIVEKYVGDAVMAVFGIPMLHEDDALRAVRAAAAIPATVERLAGEFDQRLPVRLQVRVAVATGEVVAGAGVAGGQRLATGDAVNVAARLQGLAEPGGVVLAETTHRLVRDSVRAEPRAPVTVRGKVGPLRPWRLLSVDPTAGRRMSTDAPLVGRDAELAALRSTFGAAVADAGPRRRTVLGAAGVGKSRLLAEFLTGLPAGTTVLRGRCLSYGQGITFWPIREVLAAAAGWTEDDTADGALGKLADLLPGRPDAAEIADHVAHLVGLGRATSGLRDSFAALTRLLDELATWAPLVLVVDDLHWAEPTLHELLDHLARFLSGPVLLLGAARPELVEARPDQPSGEPLVLDALAADDAATLLTALLAPGRPPERIAAHVLATAEGNPLFVEHLVAMLRDDGTLVRSADGEWELGRELRAGELPGTIHGLLAARLERLDPSEQRELEAGAVVGRVFWRGAVAELARDAVGADAGTHLDQLVGRRLLLREARTFVDEDAYKFQHVLVRDAAYAAMPKTERATAHQRFAAWLETAARGRTEEYDEILGYHREQAVRLRAEVGAPDEGDRELATQAGRHLAAAGRRSFGRGDLSTTLGLLERAERLLGDDGDLHVEVLTDLGQALWLAGRPAPARERLLEARQRAAAHDDRIRLLRAELALIDVASWMDADWGSDSVRPSLEEWIDELGELGDHQGLAEAWAQLGRIDFDAGRAAAAEEALERALAHGRRCDRRVGAQPPLIWLLLALAYGPTPVPRALRRMEELAGEADGDLHVQCQLLNTGAVLAAMQKDFGRAWRLAAAARRLFDEAGVFFGMASCALAAFDVALREGRLAAAEAPLIAADEVLAGMGEEGGRCTVLALLASVHLEAGRVDESERCAALARDMTPSGDTYTEVMARGVLARVQARRGRHDAARELADEAVALTASTDNLILNGDALLDLAEVMGLSGDDDDAHAAAEQALALYERKGDLASADRARERSARFRKDERPPAAG